MQLSDETVDERIRTYYPAYSPTATQKPYDSNSVYYLEDRVRWLELEVVRSSQVIEALCAVFQRIGK